VWRMVTLQKVDCRPDRSPSTKQSGLEIISPSRAHSILAARRNCSSTVLQTYGSRIAMAATPTSAKRRTSRALANLPAGAARTETSLVGGTELDKVWSRIRLLIIHPDMDPEIITTTLGMAPRNANHKFGNPRVTPKGTSLPGIFPDTRWSKTFESLDGVGPASAVAQALDVLSCHRAFWTQLTETGGTAELILSLDGGTYQGDSIRADQIRQLADLGIGLGIEVYPVPQSG
jgi:hypothetical protein